MDATFIWKLSKLGRIGSSRLRFDDDYADRLNYQYSGVLMFLFIGVIGIRQYVGKPIQCWIPQEFTRGWEEYAENYCWVSNTYFSPLTKGLPPNYEREANHITYYQWAPILMALQAFLFYCPCLIWRLLNNRSGFNVRKIMLLANDCNELIPDSSIRNIKLIARHMEACIFRQRKSYSVTKHEAHISKQQSFPVPAVFSCSSPHHVNRQNSSLKKNLSSTFIRSDSPEQAENNSDKKECKFLKSIDAHSVSLHGFQQSPKSPLNVINSKSICGNKYSQNSSSKSRCHNVDDLKNINENKKPPTFESSTKYQLISGNTYLPNTKKRCKCTFIFQGKFTGNYLVVLYMFIKVLYLLNIVGQMFLMEKFVGSKYPLFGFRVLLDLAHGTNWFKSGNFPRVTFCDFEAKKLGKNQRYTIQCVLPVNMFLEKMFIFLWFWHFTVCLITAFSFVKMFIRMGFSKNRISFIKRYLKIMAFYQASDKTNLRNFVEHYLRPDCVFILRLMSMNIGDMMAGDLVCELWQNYRYRCSPNLNDGKYIDPNSSLVQVMTSDQPKKENAFVVLNDDINIDAYLERNKFLHSAQNCNDDSIV